MYFIVVANVHVHLNVASLVLFMAFGIIRWLRDPADSKIMGKACFSRKVQRDVDNNKSDNYKSFFSKPPPTEFI